MPATIDNALFARARNFLICTRGATAVEFALVAAPFFALLIAILQTALIFLAQQVLQTATTEAARLVMTGQAQPDAAAKTFADQAKTAAGGDQVMTAP